MPKCIKPSAVTNPATHVKVRTVLAQEGYEHRSRLEIYSDPFHENVYVVRDMELDLEYVVYTAEHVPSGERVDEAEFEQWPPDAYYYG